MERNTRRAVLEFAGVGMTYHTAAGETPAAKDLNFCVYEGEFVAVIGPSGCGKTTLLSLAAGLLRPSEGSVLVYGRPPARGAQACGGVLPRVERIRSPQQEQRALALAEKYGLGGFLKHYPDQLSGGMRQRAALIRTLAADPHILLLDEPFSALDYQTRLNVCDDVYNIIRSEQKTAVLVTHDISEAISVADRVLVLSARPARVLCSHALEFGSTVPLKRRESPRFSGWFELLWKELNV